MINLAIVAVGVAVINLPFGFWRAGVRKFSPAWFVAVHGPVPFVVGLRLLLHVGWHFSTLPVLIGMYFSGQYVGGLLKERRSRKS